MPTNSYKSEQLSDDSDDSDNESVDENSVNDHVNSETEMVENTELSNTAEVNEKKKKQSSFENYTELHQYHNQLNELDSTFSDIEKDFEKAKKDYLSDRKKMMREMQGLFKKLSKSLPIDLNKKSKKRSGGASGGFTKKCPVPAKLRAYLELDDDVEMTRPEVMSMLSGKFKEAGFRDGKLVTITSGKVAKSLGCKKNYKIEFNRFQTFLKKFYDEEKEQTLLSA